MTNREIESNITMSSVQKIVHELLLVQKLYARSTTIERCSKMALDG